jgi:ABC-type uncharacterized transport system permease subunit
VNGLGQIFNNTLLFAILLETTPIFLAALGGAFTQQAGILNIALEGMMLIGAFAGITVGASTQNIWIALLASVGAGVGLAAVFGLASLWGGADFIVVGIGIGLVASGLSLLLLETLYNSEGSYTPTRFPDLPRLHLGILSHVPLIGPAFEGQTVLVLFGVLAIPVAWWILYRTPFGVHVRSVGEYAEAAATAGLPVRKLKMITVLISGAFCGLAGAQLAMGTLDAYVSNMTAGRGFIAVAAVFFGRARPLGVFVGCLVFGVASALVDQLQLQHLPSNLVLMIPYGVTVAVLFGRSVVDRRRRLWRTRDAVEEGVA